MTISELNMLVYTIYWIQGLVLLKHLCPDSLLQFKDDRQGFFVESE